MTFDEAYAQMRDPERYQRLRALTFDQRHPCPVEDCRLSAEEHHRVAYGLISEIDGLKKRIAAMERERENRGEEGV